MERCICIHGHFYQPPRESPWLEAIELQDSAYPYHDWNERITAECYAPNAASRILDGSGFITQIVNNYARISFNFGPTLLAWMEAKAPDVYQAILEADRESQTLFSGHGSAMAQVYNHMILPLANTGDKHTQIRWGVRDFELRFGRFPEGMWLPETAVDLETLDLLAGQGVRFTVLAPHQAGRVRRIEPAIRDATDKDEWNDVQGGRIDPTMPYLIRLPSGRSIAVFFYDGPISRGVAFEGLLTRGENLAERLLGGFSDERTWPQLVHIATDGETYGHHHRHGDMALAYALDYIERNELARLTNYAEHLAAHPPTHEAEIVEATSWSCVHGIERWRSNCGCNSGGRPGWSQAWRTPLREALDWLRDELAPLYEAQANAFLKDPWAARDDYIDVVLDRSMASLERFLARHAARELEEGEVVSVLKLLEMQRHAMLMYTSCGWFFDELSGIETVQVLQYAGRALQLGQELFLRDFEDGFLGILENAKSNLPHVRDGREVFQQFVRPAVIDLPQVAAHYAVSSVFEQYLDKQKIYSYMVERESFASHRLGKARLVLGRGRVESEVTRQSATLDFGVLHLGDHNLNGGVRRHQGEEAYEAMVEDVSTRFEEGDLPEVIRALDKHFGSPSYSIRSLFRDEQRRVLERLLEETLEEAGGRYVRIHREHAPMMRYLADLGIPLPPAFRLAAEFVVNDALRKLFSAEGPEVDIDRARALLDEARSQDVPLDGPGLGYALEVTFGRLAGRLAARPEDLGLLQALEAAVAFERELPFEASLWPVQNQFYALARSVFPRLQERASAGDPEAETWVERFLALGEKLRVRVPGA